MPRVISRSLLRRGQAVVPVPLHRSLDTAVGVGWLAGIDLDIDLVAVDREFLDQDDVSGVLLSAADVAGSAEDPVDDDQGADDSDEDDDERPDRGADVVCHFPDHIDDFHGVSMSALPTRVNGQCVSAKEVASDARKLFCGEDRP